MKLKAKIHAIAGVIGFVTILIFWTMTIYAEVFGTHTTILVVKNMVLKGMLILIPAMAIAGGMGMSIGRKRRDVPGIAKKKRMPIIGANGLLVLVPSAFYLASKATNGDFDTAFYTVQAVELIAGLANLTMIGLNIRDGLRMTKYRRKKTS